jgi:hypothetical protein
MDAAPILAQIAQLLTKHSLDAVLIGNAAAALQGAPVTTIDVDFMFRKTPANLRKLKAIARELDAVVMCPFYPVSGLFRIVRDEDGLQLDFMSVIDGIRSFEGVRSRATAFPFTGGRLLVASLADIIKSKKAAGRPKDLAVLPLLESAHEKAPIAKGPTRGSQKRK